jgi:thioredoxin 1
MTEPVAVTQETFEAEVLRATMPVLVDFWAAWCAPCRMVAPLVDEIAGERAEQLKVAKVDVDESPQIATRFGIMSIPTLILFKDGQPVEQMVGYVPKDRLMERVEPYLQARF